MANQLHSLYNSQIGAQDYHLIRAFRIARLRSHITFLRQCWRSHLIPFGFRVKNKIQDTLTEFSEIANSLVTKQSRGWLRLAINCYYIKLHNLTNECLFPLTYSQQRTLNSYNYFLRCVKRSKLRGLHEESNSNEPLRDPVEPINGFTNKSTVSFTSEETDLLQLGPSYVPPRKMNVNQISLETAQNIQCCMYRLEKKSPALAQSNQVTEFFSGINRITIDSVPAANNNTNRSISRIINSIQKKAKLAPIMPSDKTKRLVALDNQQYNNMLCTALNPQDERVRTVLPSTTQQRFNRQIQAIASHYSDNDTRIAISNVCITEPMPSKPYALPKDHKPGELKGRPIISTVDSVVKPLSVLLAKVLNPLVRLHVPAHLESTSEFIEALQQSELPGEFTFGSLDIVNLYGAIPIHPTEGAPGLIDVATNFFASHHADSSMPHLSVCDFRSLLTLCLSSDTYFINDSSYKQTKGVAMGNSAAPPLAIIYIHYIEENVKQSVNQIVFWRRYIDDIFFITTTSPDELLLECNRTNVAINFTIELPDNNTIPFLDTLVKWSSDSRKFTFQLYIKPTHSGACLPYSSYVPKSRKTNLVKSETTRAIRNSSHAEKSISTEKITTLLKRNGYPQSFITKYANNNMRPSIDNQYTTYIKIPYVSHSQYIKIKRLKQLVGLSDIRIIFTTERPLGRMFQPKRQLPTCPVNCPSCVSAIKQGQCMTKYAVYCIECAKCGQFYYGESSRPMRSRIRDHLTKRASNVFQHLESCCQALPQNIKWKVMCVEPNYLARIAMEALLIKKDNNRLINGCTGRSTLPFL